MERLQKEHCRPFCGDAKPQLMSACTRVGQDNYEEERHMLGIWWQGAPLFDVCVIFHTHTSKKQNSLRILLFSPKLSATKSA